MILENTIKFASKILKNNNIHSHELDAEIILSNIMGVTREFLIINNNFKVSKNIIRKFNHAINRRVKKEPVAYIIGQKEFWSQNFYVNRATLVPRPETELLIYKVVNFFNNKSINVLDIGTGSGCILLSILKELRSSRGIGIDVSAETIKTARANAAKFNLSNRSKFEVFNIKQFYTGKYDLIVSNPPYIASKDIKNLSEDIKNYEPLTALNGGIDGLDLIKKVIYKSNRLLKKNGLLAIEIGNNQYIKVSSLLRQNRFREKSKEYDYNHNVRCIISTKL
jgi:release factor glutamine methyltransferase